MTIENYCRNLYYSKEEINNYFYKTNTVPSDVTTVTNTSSIWGAINARATKTDVKKVLYGTDTVPLQPDQESLDGIKKTTSVWGAINARATNETMSDTLDRLLRLEGALLNGYDTTNTAAIIYENRRYTNKSLSYDLVKCLIPQANIETTTNGDKTTRTVNNMLGVNAFAETGKMVFAYCNLNFKDNTYKQMLNKMFTYEKCVFCIIRFYGTKGTTLQGSQINCYLLNSTGEHFIYSSYNENIEDENCCIEHILPQSTGDPTFRYKLVVGHAASNLSFDHVCIRFVPRSLLYSAVDSVEVMFGIVMRLAELNLL